MRFQELSVNGCYLIEPEPFEDERGWHVKCFSSEEFKSWGLEETIHQVSLVRSSRVGTIRGIHWQEHPYSEAKIVRCIAGRVFDVCVDLRADSNTRGSWTGAELTAQNRLAIYLPPGCGHAFQAMEPESDVVYTSSQPYVPDSERGARWDDPSFGIDWPLKEDLVLSEKDRSWPLIGMP